MSLIGGRKEKMDLQKHKAWRSETYLAWVRTLPSAISGQPAGDCHHIKGYGFGGSVKAPDYMTIPLTREEHTKFHTIGWRSWEKLQGSGGTPSLYDSLAGNRY